MFDVEPDLEVLVNGLHRSIHLRQHLMFAFVKEPVPQDDFGIFDKRSPELDEITVARPFACERILHELVELKVAFVRAIEGYLKLDQFVQNSLAGKRPSDGYFVRSEEHT